VPHVKRKEQRTGNGWLVSLRICTQGIQIQISNLKSKAFHRCSKASVLGGKTSLELELLIDILLRYLQPDHGMISTPDRFRKTLTFATALLSKRSSEDQDSSELMEL